VILQLQSVVLNLQREAAAPIDFYSSTKNSPDTESYRVGINQISYKLLAIMGYFIKLKLMTLLLGLSN